MIRVREIDMERDLVAVEELEKRVEVGSLIVDELGDPMFRIRHAPDHIMLVAEYGESKDIVGVVRACVKMVTRGRPPTSSKPAYVKVAYILGLRVSPSHRRRGIATALVQYVETWSSCRGAAYTYMSTTAENAPSLALFTNHRLSYSPFRRPLILAHPVHSHNLPFPSRRPIRRLSPTSAAALYARLLPPSSAELLPLDFPSLLSHHLTLGSFLAISSSSSSFALLSVFDSTRAIRLRIAKTPSLLLRTSMAILRALDTCMPWARIPSIRDVFKPFGIYILFGLCMSGSDGPSLLHSLCRFAHNLAMRNPACAFVVADVGSRDPARTAVPHWRCFSSDQDVLCVKCLRGNTNIDDDDDDDDWIASPPPSDKMIFVDPREL
ncbi:putative N-acetyltransferase HLS1 [Ananas comosus]|uniref:Putative N-acetyltransferase HLS1 n=1 Tax=Ananas comosus TaxID=4615 RepID=A0A199UEB3_ANACO|nr:putative N-acetyltransferase HLS1 [Ananas comosus]